MIAQKRMVNFFNFIRLSILPPKVLWIELDTGSVYLKVFFANE